MPGQVVPEAMMKMPTAPKQEEVPTWVDELKSKPAEDKEVYISIVRRAKWLDGKWVLVNSAPIDLQADTVHWMEIPS